MTRRRQRLILIAGSLLLALVATEVGLRLAARWLFLDLMTTSDPVLGWVLRPNYAGWSTDENMVWVQHNSAGFLDREWALAAAPNTIRVAVLGDSFIHGYYLPSEERFTTALEQNLNACAPGGTSVEVLNFGVLGYATTQELLAYRNQVTPYHPQAVVLAIYTANDIFENHPHATSAGEFSPDLAPRHVFSGDTLVLDNSFRAGLPPPSRWPLRRRVFESLTEHWRLFRLLKETADRVRWNLTSDDSGHATNQPIPDNMMFRAPASKEMIDAWAITEALLLKFAAEVRANGSELWIATLSNTAQVDPDVSQRRAFERALDVDSLFYAERRIAAFGTEHGIPVIDLAEPLADYTATHGTYLNGGNNRRVPAGVGHWNALGARLSAELVARQLCSESPQLTAVRAP